MFDINVRLIVKNYQNLNWYQVQVLGKSLSLDYYLLEKKRKDKCNIHLHKEEQNDC